jgi:hypothetical protein
VRPVKGSDHWSRPQATPAAPWRPPWRKWRSPPWLGLFWGKTVGLDRAWDSPFIGTMRRPAQEPASGPPGSGVHPSIHIADSATGTYQRREPEKTILYQVVAEYLETFLGEVRTNYDKPLPNYVEKELREFLKCGQLPYGFLRAYCKDCGRSLLVPFSCKRRGACPLCFVAA